MAGTPAVKAHHSWLIAITGNCYGKIPVCLSQRAERVRLAGLQTHHTVCGIGFTGEGARYRMPGVVSQHGVITYQRCR